MESRGGQATTSYSPAALPFQHHFTHYSLSIPKRWKPRTDRSHRKAASKGVVCQTSQSGRDGRQAVQMLMDLARLGNLEGLLDLVPDSVIEKAIERKQQMRHYAKMDKSDTVTFVEVALMSAQPDFFVGAYALRALVFSKPVKCELLSSMELAPGEFIQRCHVTVISGEQMILAFRLCLEERCQPSYRGFTTGKAWVLRSVKGESAGEDGQWPTEPDPRWGPESVVCGQLEALRNGDIESALSFVFPPDKEAPSSGLQSSLIHRIPAYAPLLYHHGYSVAATAQMSAESSVIFVGVHGRRSLEGDEHDQYTLPYMWFLSLQQGNTWMIDSVQHVAGS